LSLNLPFLSLRDLDWDVLLLHHKALYVYLLQLQGLGLGFGAVLGMGYARWNHDHRTAGPNGCSRRTVWLLGHQHRRRTAKL
jgi:hypothetical protein